MSIEVELQSINGNLSLTPWLNVEAGAGMEPGDPRFTEKVFARSLLKTGATLSLESLHEKELLFPLKLNASSKEALTGLVEQINIILRTAGCQLKWKDEGANVPTYFDVISGQFDDEFDFRLGQNNWLKGRLRIFTQPLGFREATREGIVQVHGGGGATNVVSGSGPVLTFQCATAPGGDAPALLNIPEAACNGQFALSVLPQGSYSTMWPVASAYGIPTFATGATLIATSTAFGGEFYRYGNYAGTFQDVAWHIPTGAYQYAGEQRLLLVARAASPSFGLRMRAGYTTEDTPIPTITSANWQLIDMGVLAIPSVAVAPGYGNGQAKLEILRYASAAATSYAMDIAGFIMLPEKSTMFAKLPEAETVAINGYSNTVVNLLNGAVNTGRVKGAIPEVPVGGSAPVIAWLTGFTGNSEIPNRSFSVNLIERTRYAF